MSEIVKTADEAAEFERLRAAWERRNRLAVEAHFAAEDDHQARELAEVTKRVEAARLAKVEAAKAEADRRAKAIAAAKAMLPELLPTPPAVTALVAACDHWREAHAGMVRLGGAFDAAAANSDAAGAEKIAAEIVRTEDRGRRQMALAFAILKGKNAEGAPDA